MRIIYHHRTLGDGAEGIHIAEMVGAFRSLGHEVKVVAPIGDNTNTANARVSAFSRIKRFVPKILYEFLEIGYNVYGYYLLRKEILEDRPDFIYDRYITFNASSVLIGKKYNIPVFLEVNAPLALERSEQEDERLFLKKAAFFFEKWICSNSFKTIAVSTPLREYLMSLSVPAEKIVVMPNGVNVRKFVPRGKDERLLEQYGFSEDNVIVGFVGILRPWHGLNILLEAFQVAENENKNLRLLIVGDGPIRSDIEEKIRGLALVDKVFITGRVSHDEIPNNVALFDIAVSPKATFYASPMKILEYMALGKAVVAPDTTNIRDIIDDKVNGFLFENGNPLALSVSINKLVENRRYMKQLGIRACTKIIRERNWDRNASATCKLLQRWHGAEVHRYKYDHISNSMLNDTVLEQIRKYYKEDSHFRVRSIRCRLRDFSIVREIEVFFASGNKAHLHIKKYRKECFSNAEEMVQKEFMVSNKYQSLFDNNDKFGIVRHIIAIPEDLTLVSEHVDGDNLFDLSSSIFAPFRKKYLWEIYWDCGRLLKALHESQKRYDYFDFQSMIEYVDVRLENLCNNDSRYFSAFKRLEILNAFRRLCNMYTSEELVISGLHGDFIPPNIIIGPRKLFLIDWSNFRYGPIYNEIGYFLVFSYVQRLKAVCHKEFLQRLENQFMKGYDTADLDRNLLALFMLKHLINFAWRILMNIRNQRYYGLKKYYYYRLYKMLFYKIDVLAKSLS